MADRTVNAIYCPGWAGINNPDKTYPCGGRSSNANLIAFDPTRTVSKPEVHDGKTVNVLTAEPGYDVPCPRCRKQKAKWDEEHGLRAQRAQEAVERRQGILRAYAADLGVELDPKTRGILIDLIERADRLEQRDSLPPFKRYSEERRYYSEHRQLLGGADKYDAIRVLLGLGESDE